MNKEKIFTGLPAWAQGTIAVAITAAIGVTIYKVYQMAKDRKEQAGSRVEDNSWNRELNKLNSNPKTKATLSTSQMASLSNTLFTAMDGYGTDFPVIVDAFTQIKNDADFAGVSAAFGIREISSGRLNPEPNLKGTLSQALTSELGKSTTIAGLALPIYGLYQLTAADDQKSVINKILTKNKVTYRV